MNTGADIWLVWSERKGRERDFRMSSIVFFEVGTGARALQVTVDFNAHINNTNRNQNAPHASIEYGATQQTHKLDPYLQPHDIECTRNYCDSDDDQRRALTQFPPVIMSLFKCEFAKVMNESSDRR